MRLRLSLIFFLLFSLFSCRQEISGPLTEEQISQLISRMSLVEKLELLGGVDLDTKSLKRLNIPALRMTDGPLGVRMENATAFPAGVALGATWDTTLVKQAGKAMAVETKAHGRHMLLGPCINIVRTPLGGRNFESYGEDPFLSSRLAVAWIKGLQGEGVAASVKHFAVNNQETERMTISAEVTERTLREIYLPAFEAAVKEGQAWTVMAAYNRLNGTYCSENDWLLNTVLRGEWNFSGFVVSDWGAVHSSIPTAQKGVDLEMPYGTYMNPESLLAAVQNGEIPESIIDLKLQRIFRVMNRAGLFDPARPADPEITAETHRNLNYRLAAESMVLLKNEGALLPLAADKIKTVAVIGPNMDKTPTGGGGSSRVEPFYSVSVLQGLRDLYGAQVEFVYETGVYPVGQVDPIPDELFTTSDGGQIVPGVTVEYFNNQGFQGKPTLTRIEKNILNEWGGGSPAAEIAIDHFSARWSTTLTPHNSALIRFDTKSDDGIRLFIDNQLVIENWTDHASTTDSYTMPVMAGKKYDIRMEYYENEGSANASLGWFQPDDQMLSRAVNAAASADAAIICVGTSDQLESEGFDRKSFDLPEGQVELIHAVAGANPNTIVVLVHGQPLNFQPWVGKVPAVVEAWFPGSEGGHAVADVLFGKVNPCAKLPVSFPKNYSDNPTCENFPGNEGTVRYDEGLLVGYRYYDTKKIEPQYSFGHGLSYTSYEYGPVRLTNTGHNQFMLSCPVKNSGDRAGAEIVQLYIRPLDAGVFRPEKELKAFTKLRLEAGESGEARFELDKQAFRYFDESLHAWKTEAGKYEILIGSSSRDIRQKMVITLSDGDVMKF